MEKEAKDPRAGNQKIPYMLVVGQKEEEEKTVSVFLPKNIESIQENDLRETVKADKL